MPTPALIIGLRTDDPHHRDVPSKILSCEACGYDTYFSHATLARVIADNLAPVFKCIECANLEGLTMLPPNAEQVAEVAAAGYPTGKEHWALSEFWGKPVRRRNG